MQHAQFVRHILLARARAAPIPLDPDWVRFEAAEYALLQIAKAEVAPGVFVIEVDGTDRFYAVDEIGNIHELERE